MQVSWTMLDSPEKAGWLGLEGALHSRVASFRNVAGDTEAEAGVTPVEMPPGLDPGGYRRPIRRTPQGAGATEDRPARVDQHLQHIVLSIVARGPLRVIVTAPF